MTSEVSNQYADIDLTEEQIQEALRAAREKEYFRRRHEAYLSSLTTERQYPQFRAEELMDFFKMQYQVDDANRAVVANLCFYFSGDKRFSGDLNKGLLLSGGVGVGKTSLMQFFARNQIFSYRMVHCRDVEKNFAQDGYDAIDKYSNNLPVAINANPFGHQIIGFCFDDLGTEENSKHYGKEKNMMAEILLNRYDFKLPYHSTHITTNLTAAEIKEQYGTRVTDRLREMVNVITFDKNTQSRRK